MANSNDDYFVLRADGFIHSSDVRHVSSADGVLLTASRDQTAMLHESPPPTDNISAGVAFVGHTAFVNFALWHPAAALLDGEACIVTGSNDKHVALWNPATAGLEAVLDAHAHGVCCGAVLQPSGDIVTGDWGGVCIVFNGVTGDVKQSYTAHKTAVRGVAQLPGTTTVVSASGDKTVHQWDVVTGATLAVFEGHKDVVQCVCAMSATRFASGSNDATIAIWDTTAGPTPLRILVAHDSLLYGLCYCPSRHLLFSASEDRTVKVWRGGVVDVTVPAVAGGEAVVVQSINHPCVVWSVCVTSTGDIATGSADGVLRVWTTHDDKMASVEKLQALETAIAAQTIDVKVAAAAGLDTASMPSVDKLHLRKGAAQGERLLARTESGSIEVYVWNCGRWDKVGTVVEGPQGNSYTGNPQPRAKTYLNGVPHDYVFDVDVNGKMLKLSYDRGQSVFDAAQNFINENSRLVSQGHKEEIQNFILSNVDPTDAQLGSGSSPAAAAGGGEIGMTSVTAGAVEPTFSEFAREAAALRQTGATHIPSWGEALRNMEAAGVSANEVAFSGYAREGMALQQQQATQRSAATPGDERSVIVPWDSYKLFTALNAAGAQKKIGELTGDSQLVEVVPRVVAAAKGEPSVGIIEEIMALYHRLPESSRFPAVDLLSHLLAAAAHPFGWLLLLLGDGEQSAARAFLAERMQNLRNVPDAEALVTMRLIAHAAAALDKPPAGTVLMAPQLALLLTAVTKAPQPLLRATNSNVKGAISAVLRNAALLLTRGAAVLGGDGVRDATQGVVRLVAQWLVWESASSPHTPELVATLLTLVHSPHTAAAAVDVGRSTLGHTLRALKTCAEPHCQEAAATILRAFDAAESH